MMQDLHDLWLGTVQALCAAIEAKDPHASGHSERVGLLASMAAQTLRLRQEEIQFFQIAGLLHDIGKINIPEALLTKQEKLTAAEIALIQRHPEIGYQILKNVPQLNEALPGVLHHHERFDGFGYPRGLAGHEIPLVARVLALCDSFDAMSSNRSYRHALMRQQVIEEIRTCSGTQFDPALVPAFLAMDFTPFDQALGRHAARWAA